MTKHDIARVVYERHGGISNREAAEWERGTGSMSDANTLVRDTVIESTNSNNAVNFSAGVKDVTNDIPAGTQWSAISSITGKAIAMAIVFG